MKPRILMLCLVATLVLAGCGNKSQTADEPVVSSLPPTSTTTDPYAVPSAIDAAYVNKVLAAIENGRGTMRRAWLTTSTFSPQDQAILEALYSGDALQFQLRLWSDTAPLDHSKFTSNPPAAIVAVKTLKHVDPGCIWVTAIINDAASETKPTGPSDIDYVLKYDKSHDEELNPTPWKASEATTPNTLTASQACG